MSSEARLDTADGGRRWHIEHCHGQVAAFHERPIPEPAQRALWLFHVSEAALVLGSAQREDGPDGRPLVDAGLAAARSVPVVRRRSGGSAVLLEPGAVVWADVIVPRGDPLWDDDIGRAAWWVGRWWQRALCALGIAADVHTGRFERRRWSDRICFAGLGPGEVLIGGRKVVGVAQRRTRQAARFQTAALLHWEPALLAALCCVHPLGAPLDPALSDAAVGLADVASGGASIDAGAVHAALATSLPA